MKLKTWYPPPEVINHNKSGHPQQIGAASEINSYLNSGSVQTVMKNIIQYIDTYQPIPCNCKVKKWGSYENIY